MDIKFPKKVTVLMTILSFSSLIGCSNQWREADLGMDAAEVLDILNTQYEANASSAANSQQFFALKNNEYSTIYYADGYSNGGPLGPLVSVFSVVDYGFMGSTELSGLTFYDLSEARIAFIWLPTETGDQCALLVDVKVASTEAFVTRYFNCISAGVDGGEFVAILDGADGQQIVLRSYDVYASAELKGVIQLRLNVLSGGVEYDNGKISTLVGFGP